MSSISVSNFISGLNTIRSINPVYKVGHDGSDGSCDSIGFIRGGLLRGGATKITNMKEPNQFARKTAIGIRQIDSSLAVGSIVLSVASSDDNSMPLPLKYRSGGKECNGDTNNYVDIGVVTSVSPVEVTHMTSDGIATDKSLSGWDYVCSLPYVVEEGDRNPMTKATISGKAKLFISPSLGSEIISEINSGETVSVTCTEKNWARVMFHGNSGYVLSKFLQEIEEKKPIEISPEDIEKLEEAYNIIGAILGHK